MRDGSRPNRRTSAGWVVGGVLMALLAPCGGGDDDTAEPAKESTSPTASPSSAASSSAGTTDWSTVSVEGVRAALPGTPQPSSLAVPTTAGRLTFTTYTTGATSDRALTVMVGRLPKSVAFDLDGSAPGAAKSSGLPLAGPVEKTTVDGADARSFRLAGTSNGRPVSLFQTVALRDRVVVQVIYVVAGQDVKAPPRVYTEALDAVRFPAG